ncbi:NAD(+) kinase [Gammaproteobacteria bacterium LSUCC0057]|uniref:NAD kinase n=1 Tax=Gammaproteobacteria bacterium LSUCC0057 TaxID=2559237 RepID=A0A4Y8UKG6_9GAMM|nr:NAD(+) kinase [Gammaproteobacteria bacterium LSUCC0057]
MSKQAPLHFTTVALLASVKVEAVSATLEKLEQYLLSEGCEVLFEQSTAELMAHNPASLPIAEFAGRVDLSIVVGGDGSMLSAARKIAASGIPMLGINRGRLGFLTDISPDELAERVAPVLRGHYTVSQRFMLDARISRNGELLNRGRAVNDVVLHPGRSVRMMEFDLYVDKQFVYSQSSDGVIVATPTGSTAYALSAGGPILFPELDAIIVVPLNPHTLSSRPITLSGSACIELQVSARNELMPLVTCDGHNDFVTQPGDVITITKHPDALLLIHPQDHNFYQICRSKLGWGGRLGRPLKEQ